MVSAPRLPAALEAIRPSFPSGPITIPSTFTGPANGLKDFDVIIPLTTPFLYNPGLGNLLLDGTQVLSDRVSRIRGVEGSPSGETGFADTLGPVTRFTFAGSTVNGRR